jgi:hypothetical protein
VQRYHTASQKSQTDPVARHLFLSSTWMDSRGGPQPFSGTNPPRLRSPLQQLPQIPPVRELEHGPSPLSSSLHAPNLTTYVHHVRKSIDIRAHFQRQSVCLIFVLLLFEVLIGKAILSDSRMPIFVLQWLVRMPCSFLCMAWFVSVWFVADHYTFHGSCTIYQASDVPQVYAEPGSYDQSHTVRQHDMMQAPHRDQRDPRYPSRPTPGEHLPFGAALQMRPVRTPDTSQQLTNIIPHLPTTTISDQDGPDERPRPLEPPLIYSRERLLCGMADADVSEPPTKRRAQSPTTLPRHEPLQPYGDPMRMSPLRPLAGVAVAPACARVTTADRRSHVSQEFRTSKSSTPSEDIMERSGVREFGAAAPVEYPMSEATQTVLLRGSSLASIGMSDRLQHTDERHQSLPDLENMNDWEHVVAMYMTGHGTPDGRPLRSIAKGHGHKVEDRKLLEKRRTIGKTYEILGKERFERAIGYTHESGEKRKRKMYHVIARCRIVNAIRKANGDLPEDPVDLDNLISYQISLKTESRQPDTGSNGEQGLNPPGAPP